MGKKTLKEFWTFRNTLVVLLTPLLLLPLPIAVPTAAAKTGYVLAIMAVYWITEAIPMAMTALVPMAMIPLMGVMTSKELAKNYIQDICVLQLAGFINALAIEKCDLHKRIALRILLLVGSRPKWLMFGFILTTWFLAMWMSTTGSTVAMMIPILEAVLGRLDELHQRELRSANGKANPAYENDADDSQNISKTGDADQTVVDLKEAKSEEASKDKPPGNSEASYTGMQKGLTLCIAYSASIGGLATLTGHSTNLIFKSEADSVFANYDQDPNITFASWLTVGFPLSLLCVVMAWLWLQLLFLGWRTTFCLAQDDIDSNEVRSILRKEYKKLGPMSFAQIAVLIHFIVLTLMWLTRDPRFIDGWAWFFPKGYVTDATAAMVISLSLFVFPSEKPRFLCCREKGAPASRAPSLMDWETVHSKLPWHIVLLIGGGLAMADACKRSGLSEWIGEAMSNLSYLSPPIMVLLLCILAGTMTEFISNTATTTLLMPILAGLALELKLNPLYLMWPVELCTNMTFMLPVGTSANAFVFAYGRIRVWDMVKAGFVLNILCISIVTLGFNTWGESLFNLRTFPFDSLDAMNTTSPHSNITTTPTI